MMSDKKCPICGNFTVEWQTERERIAMTMNYISDKELPKNFNEEGGSWLCNYNKGGCGSESGWKKNDEVYTWQRRS